MLAVLLGSIAILARTALLPNSLIIRLVRTIMTRPQLLHKAVSNDARQNTNRTSTPEQRNNADDQKLKTLLPTFCKYHHTHAGCPPPSRHNAQYKRMLQEGLKRMQESVYLRAEIEEIYPKYFNDYCAGRPVEARQKKLMVEFFNAWITGIQAFMQDEASRRMINGAP